MRSRKFLNFLFLILIAALFATNCKKSKTVISDSVLLENPGEKKPVYVPDGKVKRGEFVTLLEEKDFNGTKYNYIQIKGVDTKGWLDEKNLYEGELQSATIVRDADLFLRPNEKSEKSGKARAGQVVFKLEEKDNFVYIQYPGKKAYIAKSDLGDGVMVVKSIEIPGLGSGTISASSQYIQSEGKELDYDPRNVFDGKFQTGWCEGKTGDDGLGEYVNISFPTAIHLSEISVVNGLARSEESYKLNNRIASLKVESSYGGTVTLDLDDNNFDLQAIPVDLVGSSFRFIITKVHKGKVNDSCVSEIKLTGSEYTAPASENQEGSYD
ncbi:NADase-type glycan-binding domain-containing protein [Leptospira sarikeiensis]|uniref:NAD glycohydrolase translocation F5/8 type C domain-containing protein n=1 Tax=Leptospira sarikeiensis TaxID=2484943 RepID=A0A4R9K0Q5_9LEPT|nr:hypothetical protein [Leptospira sarikeiensis]TGL59239.1 hypothetical protein EHQ64_16270 [Leptospira sarikeiensis]